MKRSKILMATIAPMVLISPVLATAFSVTMIADTNTPIPGGTGDFTHFDLTSGHLFVAEGSGGQQGIYRVDLSVVADQHMAAPGFDPGVNFAGFTSVSDATQNLSFIAITTTGVQAVFEQFYYPSQALRLVAEAGQSPSTGMTFSNFTNVTSTYQLGPNPRDPSQYPSGEFLSNAGNYFFTVNPTITGNSGSSVSLVQQATTTPPSDFTSLGSPSLKDGWSGTVVGQDSAIHAMRAVANGAEGIYVNYPSSTGSGPSPFVKLVDTTTPSTIGKFTSFGDPTAGLSNLVFTANYAMAGKDRQGIFYWGPYQFFDPNNPPDVQQVMGTGDLAPDSGGAHFSDFLGVTPDGAVLADLDNGTQGIYYLGGLYGIDPTVSPHRIIDTTDLLDGKSIKSFEMSREADMFLDPSGTAFIVNFTDGSQGLYYFTVPEPTWVGMAVLPLLLIRRKRST